MNEVAKDYIPYNNPAENLARVGIKALYEKKRKEFDEAQ